jgi:parallel beta-helix repeat protein
MNTTIRLRHRARHLFRLVLGLTLLATPLATSRAATVRVPQNQKTIQAGIDATKPGDTIIVSSGTYKERIRLKSGITVRSDGDDAIGELGLKRAEVTIIDGSVKGARGSGVTMAEGSVLDGFTITGVGNYDDALWNKHHATNGEEQAHEHIGELGTAGVAATGVTCTISNNIVHHIGYTGIGITGAEGRSCSPLVSGNACYRNMGGGIGSMKGSTAIIRTNTCFENFYAGIGQSAASPLVVGNTCHGNIRAGIGISEGSKPVVRGNKCYGNRRAGIGIRTGDETRPVVEDNDCYENEMAGIGIRDEAAPVIRENRCYRNKLAGIGSRTGARPIIIDNECYENEQAGIGQRSGVKSVLIGNHCHHNKAAGIGFAKAEVGDATVLNNRVIDNATVAIGVHSGWTVRLNGNELSRKGGMPPIVMVFGGARATLTDNVIRGGGVAGIRTGGEVRADNNRFEGTSLRKVGPPNFAIWALPESQVAMTGNEIDGWRHALHAAEAEILVAGNEVTRFHGAAFVIKNPTSPAHVYNNTAISKNSTDQVLSLEGAAGIVTGNKMMISDPDSRTP